MFFFLICTRALPTSMILKMTLCKGTEAALLIQDCRAQQQEQDLFGVRVWSWVVLRSWSRCASACSPFSGPKTYCDAAPEQSCQRNDHELRFEVLYQTQCQISWRDSPQALLANTLSGAWSILHCGGCVQIHARRLHGRAFSCN